MGEAGEEGAQQYAENFTKKLFGNKQDIHEGVAESALMGGIMGGAGKMAFGGMESVKNPYKSNNMADGEVSISKLHPDQMGYNKDAVLGKFTGDTRKRMSERSFNTLQDLRANNPYVTGDGQEISLTNKGNKKYTSTKSPETNEEFVAKMRSTPRIGELINNSLCSHSAYDTKNHGIAPDGFDYRTANFKYGGKNYETMFNVAKNDARNNTLYGGLTKEKNHSGGLNAAPGELVLPGQSDSYNSNIAQKDQKVNNGYQYSDEIRNKIDQSLDERLLRVRDNTGETLADFETRLKREGATEQEIEPYKNSFIRRAKMFLEEPGSMPGWSLDQDSKQNNETNLEDFNFQSSTINENTRLYHGTNGKVAEEIHKNGFKRGNELDENAYFGGGYDVRDQDSVSFSTNRKVSETFAINGRDSGKGSGALIEARLLPDARVVETDAEIYAEDLNEVTERLREQGVDAVFLKSNGEDELVVLNPEKVDRNILIERYKLANQQKQALTAKLEDLKARHQNLTGDEDLVFNIFKDELQKNALGYFNPKTKL